MQKDKKKVAVECHGKGCSLEATHKCGHCGLAKYCSSKDHIDEFRQHLELRCIGLRIQPMEQGGVPFIEDEDDQGLEDVVQRLSEQISSARLANPKIGTAHPAYAEIDAYFDERFLPLLELIKERADVLIAPLINDQLPRLFDQYAAESGVAARAPTRSQRSTQNQGQDAENFRPMQPGESIEAVFARWRLHRKGKDFTELADLITRRYTSYTKLKQLKDVIDTQGASLAFVSSPKRLNWIMNMRDALQRISELVGMENAKNTLARIVRSLYTSAPFMYAQDRFFNFAIMGEAGVGKTQLAKLLGKVMYYLGLSPVYANTIVTSATDWIASYEGQTQSKAANRFAASFGGVLFIDEAYALVEKGGGGGKGFGIQALAQIINDMEVYKGLVVMVFGGYEKDIKETLYAANEGLTRRVPFELYIEAYTARDISRILELKISQSSTVVIDPEDTLWSAGWFDTTDSGHNIAVAHTANAFKSRNGSGAQTILNIAVDLIADLLYTDPRLENSYKGVVDAQGDFAKYGALRKRGKLQIPANSKSVFVLTDDVLSKAVIIYMKEVTKQPVYVEGLEENVF